MSFCGKKKLKSSNLWAKSLGLGYLWAKITKLGWGMPGLGFWDVLDEAQLTPLWSALLECVKPASRTTETFLKTTFGLG